MMPLKIVLESKDDHVRQSDFDFFMCPESQVIVQQEGINLLNYEALQV